MTYDEMRNLRIGDTVIYKEFGVECTVDDVEIFALRPEYSTITLGYKGIGIIFLGSECDEFEVKPRPKKKYKVKFDVIEHYEMTIDAENEAEAEEIYNGVVEDGEEYNYYRECDGHITSIELIKEA